MDPLLQIIFCNLPNLQILTRSKIIIHKTKNQTKLITIGANAKMTNPRMHGRLNKNPQRLSFLSTCLLKFSFYPHIPPYNNGC